MIIGLLLAPLVCLQPAIAKEGPAGGDIAGIWLDSQNAGVKMSLGMDNGIYRGKAGDDAYGYRLSCLFKDGKGVCEGDGGRLEGSDFLYHSLIELRPDGSLIENWRAFNNEADIKGTTFWKRQKDK